MKRYLVTLTKQETVEVEADTPEEARIVAMNRWSQLEKDEDGFTEIEEVL